MQTVNSEMAAFADVYGRYVNRGAFVTNRLNPNAAGCALALTKVDCAYRPQVLSAAPVLTGCFTEKDGSGSAYVFANMYEPQTGKEAPMTAFFPNASEITLYRKGEVSVISGNKLTLTLENREGVFVTVK
ncbi:MAG: hypothetical protein IJK40_09650 [Clostridia bacterium]|nr:hypothetical protein [Clostridia bacterium]